MPTEDKRSSADETTGSRASEQSSSLSNNNDASGVRSPSIPDESTKRCVECAAPIRVRAKKCTECDTYQDWRRYLPFSSTVLSLLIALFFVVGLSVPPIIGVLREQNANLHEAIISGRAGSIQEGPEYVPALCVDLLITNSGKLPGVVKAVAVKLKDDNTWNYDTVLFDKQRDDAQGATAETSAIIDPSQSRELLR